MEMNEKALKALAGRKQMNVLVGFMLAMGGGGGYWAYQQHSGSEDQIQEIAINAEMLRRHDQELRATADRVEAIAILLVQQGRYFEDMVRAVSPPKTKIPERPAALDRIEQEILRRDSRSGR